MNIVLNEAEQKLAAYLARERYSKARVNGRVDRQIGPQSSSETDLEGIGSEIAFCKLFNIYPDTEINHTPDEDCVLSNGIKVDVKATKYENGHLLVARWKKPVVEMYALMVGTFPKYRMAGFMPVKEMLKDFRLKDFGHGQGYAANQKELNL